MNAISKEGIKTPSSFKPKILVVGAGAIGGFYGGKLAQAGAHVSTLCRSDYEIVKAEGISVKSISGDFHFIPEKVISQVTEYNDNPDYILVSLKVLPEINIPEIIKPVVGSQTAIILLQNGIKIEDSVVNAFPENEIVSGLAFVCINRTGPGKIYHKDYGRLVIGNFPPGISRKTDKLCDLFNAAGINCITTSDIVKARWQKLLWNAPFNPISVLGGGVNTKEMLKDRESMNLIRNVMEEIYKLARATGCELHTSVIQKNIDDTIKMETYKTSMLLDYEMKRPMEVEAILGNTVRIARHENVSVPHVETLYALLKLINKKNL